MSNLRDAVSNLSVISGEKVKEFPGITCTRHPSRSSIFNMAFVGGREAIDYPVMKRVQEFYREINAEWCLVVPPKLTDLFGTAMKLVRISQRRSVPEMVLSREDARIPPPPAELKIHLAKTVKDTRTWTKVMVEGFTPGARNDLTSMLNSGRLKSSGFAAYTGWVHGRAVATSGLYASGGVGGIFGVSTLQRVRGRGYGAAMTWEAIRDGISSGCDVFSLQASNMGYPLYHRMGFRRVFDIEEWVVAKAPDVRNPR
jgi:hypothetical protein